MGYGKRGIRCLTPVKTLHAVRDDSWAAAPRSSKVMLALKPGTSSGGDEVLGGDMRVLASGREAAPLL